MGYETSAGRGGVQTHYNARQTEQKFGSVYGSAGPVKSAEWVVDLAREITGAPTTSNAILTGGTGNLEVSIPAYAKILSARLIVEEAVSTTGGSAAASASFTVGLEQSDGTDIDLDGLIDATDGALTIASNDIAQPRGSYLQGGSAALVPDYGTAATPGETTSIGAAAGELYLLLTIDDITGMTAVAGKIRIIVEYMLEKVGG